MYDLITKVKYFFFLKKVPAKYDDKAIATFRECVVNAGLLKDKYSNNLKFISECM